MSPSKNEVLKDIEPHLTRLETCIRVGIEEFMDLYELRHMYAGRTKASLIRDHIVEAVRREFRGDRSVHIIDRPSRFLLLIGGVAIRFKKFRAGLKSSNIPTQASLAFEHQLKLPGLDAKKLNVNAGYLLDSSGARIQGIFLTCPNGKQNHWTSELASVELAQPPRTGQLEVRKETRTKIKTHTIRKAQ